MTIPLEKLIVLFSGIKGGTKGSIQRDQVASEGQFYVGHAKRRVMEGWPLANILRFC